MLAADYPQAEQHQLTDVYFYSKILTHIILHDDKNTWMVPLSTLAGPCFSAYNKDYTKSTNHNMYIDDRTACIVEPMKNGEIRSWQFLTSDIIKNGHI